MKCLWRNLASVLLVAVALGAALAVTLAVRGRREAGALTNSAPQLRIRELRRRLPLAFEQNRGQLDPAVQFLARTRSADVFLTRGGALFGLKGGEGRSPTSFSIRWLGSPPAGSAIGEEEFPGKANYFLGNRPSEWRTEIATFRKVRYPRLYRGVDLVYYGSDGQVEFDLELAPGAELEQVRFSFEGVDSLQVDEGGDLILTVRDQEIHQRRPHTYARNSDTPGDAEARYVLIGRNEVAISLSAHDPAKGWVIDPVLVFSTYFGGSNTDVGSGIAVDGSGNIYVVGSTISPNFPTASPRQASLAGGFDAFVSKFNPSASTLLYSTYLGGTGADYGLAIAVDASGSAYLTGFTTSSDFPLANAFSGHSVLPDAFVAKLNPTGSSLVFSTYLGGSSQDTGRGIAVDGSGSAYVTGDTNSTDFPHVGGVQSSNAGGYDGFVTKFSPLGSALIYSTYLGGPLSDSAYAVAVDGSGSAYVTGSTTSMTFPLANALQATKAGGADAFVSKLNPAGSLLMYSTYLGGSDHDFGYAIAVDGPGNAVVVGQTASTNFPVHGPVQNSAGGGGDAFVTKLNSAGSALVYSTYLGGSGPDFAYGVGVDSAGSAYVTGETQSPDFPSVYSLQRAAGGIDAFVTKLDATGSTLSYSTYLGGADEDSARAIAVDSSGNAYVTGRTSSSNFQTSHALQGTSGGGQDAFVAEIGGSSTLVLSTITPTSGPPGGNTPITLSGANFAPGAVVTLGSTTATGINVISGVTITAFTPSHPAGAVDVTVSNPDAGTSSLLMGYTYQDPGTADGGSSGSTGKSGCSASGHTLFAWLTLAAMALLAARGTCLAAFGKHWRWPVS